MCFGIFVLHYLCSQLFKQFFILAYSFRTNDRWSTFLLFDFNHTRFMTNCQQCKESTSGFCNEHLPRQFYKDTPLETVWIRLNLDEWNQLLCKLGLY